MAKKSRSTPSVYVAKEAAKGPTLYQDFFDNNVAHCLTCHAVGKVTRVSEPGRSTRYIEWSHGGDEPWSAFSAPSVCHRCWEARQRARGVKYYND